MLYAQWYFELASNDAHLSDYSVSSSGTSTPKPTNLESFEGIRDFSYGLGYLFPLKKVEKRLEGSKAPFLRLNTGLSFDNMNLRTNAYINSVGYPTSYYFAQVQGRLGVVLNQTLFSKNDAVDGGRSPAVGLVLNGGMGYNHFTAASRYSRNTAINLLRNGNGFDKNYISYYYGASLHFYINKHTQLYAEYRIEEGSEISEKSGTNNQTTETYQLDKNKLAFGLLLDFKLSNRLKKQQKSKLAALEAKVDAFSKNVKTPLAPYDDSVIRARIDSIEQQLKQKQVSSPINESSLETTVNDMSMRYFPDFKKIKFELNGSYFDIKHYAPLLTKVILFMEQNPKLKIRIDGYACMTGTYKYNLSISKKRAERVRDYLITNSKISPDRIIAVGKGQTDRFSLSQDSSNRRTEFIILE